MSSLQEKTSQENPVQTFIDDAQYLIRKGL